QRLGLDLAVAGVQDQPDRGACGAKGLLQRLGRDKPRMAVGSLEEQARRLVGVGGIAIDHTIAPRADDGATSASSAVTTDVHYRRLELAQLPKEIQGTYRPSRHQLELISVSAALEFCLDHAGLFVDGESVGADWVGGEEQDDVLGQQR